MDSIKMQNIKLRFAAICFAAAVGVGGCGGGSTNSTTPPTTNQYVTAYKSVSWGNTTTVTYPSSCEITIQTTGKPKHTPNTYYPAPAMGSDIVVAHTAETDTPLAVISYAGVIAPGLQGSTATIN